MNCPVCGTPNPDNVPACISCETPLSPSASPGIQTGHTQNGEEAPKASYHVHLPKGMRLKAGAYAIGEVLGQGGFGITYKGGDLSLRRYVAIKEFFPQGCIRQQNVVVPTGAMSRAEYENVKSKFIEEARTLARFSEPGIVKVFGVFEENDTAYMVMEFLEGQTLSARMAEKGALDEAEVVSIAKNLGAALKVVHDAGIIHRDIKPNNICLSRGGRVVLIDFGTARAFAVGQTIKQTTMLTPGYAPLEQYGQQVRFGAYTDIYALAATLYHALTGTMPPPAPDRATGVEIKPPHKLNPLISRTTSDMLVQAISMKASDRPQNIDEFLDGLVHKAPAAVVTPDRFEPPPSLPWATPEAEANAEKWFHSVGGKQTGPLPRQAIQNLIKNGIIQGSTLVRREESSDWIAAGQSEWAQDVAQAQARAVMADSTYDPNRIVPLHEKPDTAFDKFMGAIPGWVFGTAILAVLLLIVGRLGLGIVRYQNGGRDFGPTLATDLLKAPQAAGLTSAQLALGTPEYDYKTLTHHYDNYVGTVRYSDGDAGTLSLQVTSRDWLYCPVTYDFTFEPTNFGPQMEGKILADINQQLKAGNSDESAQGLHLNRKSRTYYDGSFSIYEKNSSKPVSGGNVVVNVENFDSDGAPAQWTYRVN